jgi:CheY-like chemotaxis protein
MSETLMELTEQEAADRLAEVITSAQTLWREARQVAGINCDLMMPRIAGHLAADMARLLPTSDLGTLSGLALLLTRGRAS